jgi:hypothetical protein
MREERKLHKVLVGRPERKRRLGRPKRRCQDGIRMNLRETVLGCGVDSTGLGSRPAKGSFECGDKPSGPVARELVGTHLLTKIHKNTRKQYLTQENMSVFSARSLEAHSSVKKNQWSLP